MDTDNESRSADPPKSSLCLRLLRFGLWAWIRSSDLTLNEGSEGGENAKVPYACGAVGNLNILASDFWWTGNRLGWLSRRRDRFTLRPGKFTFVDGIVGTVLFATRPELLILPVVVAGIAFFTATSSNVKGWKSAIPAHYLLGFVGTFGAFEVFRLTYFGSVLPNTVTAKSPPSRDRSAWQLQRDLWNHLNIGILLDAAYPILLHSMEFHSTPSTIEDVVSCASFIRVAFCDRDGHWSRCSP